MPFLAPLDSKQGGVMGGFRKLMEGIKCLNGLLALGVAACLLPERGRAIREDILLTRLEPVGK